MKKTRFYTLIIGILLILVVGGYGAGYRLEGASIIKAAQINIEVPFAGSTVFLNNKEKSTTKHDNQTVSFRVKKDQHNVIVAHQDRWPWSKNIATENNQTYNLTSFNIARNISAEIYSEDIKGFIAIQSEIEQTNLPTIENPLVSEDSKISLYTERNTIIARWHGSKEDAPEIFCQSTECNDTAVVVSLVTDIQSLALYPHSTDKIILATDGTVSVLEIAAQGNQNFQYLIQGFNPRFILKDDTLFILDNKAIAEIILE